MMKHWMADVVACSGGTEVSAAGERESSKNIIFRCAPSRSNLSKARTGSSTKIVFEEWA